MHWQHDAVSHVMLRAMQMSLSLRVVAGCALITAAACSGSAPLSRVPDPRNAVVQPAESMTPAQTAAAWTHAQSVFETRCVVCHGCYDAPCQLKLESYGGVTRGASPAKVYESSRLTAAEPTRLGIDARLVSEWRSKGFHAVVPEGPSSERKRSVMLRLLEQKRAHPLTPEVDFAKAFTFDLDREQRCVKADDVDGFVEDHPLWGMPYALPSIEPSEHVALSDWIMAGAPGPTEPPLPAALERALAEWETYLNEPTPKRKLIARYLYEHLFLAALYFRDHDREQFFRLVRSRTPSGFAVDEIPTRRPFEDPGTDKFFYRLVHKNELRLSKTHMPYALDAARLARYRELFDAPDYAVAGMPSYKEEDASNPFRTFEALPVRSRYAFLLDEAEFFLMGFIKGPVCRGQVALNVIQERFWVAFLAPDSQLATDLAQGLSQLQTQAELPAHEGSNALPLAWLREAKQHAVYVKQRNRMLDEAKRRGQKLTLDLLWDGAGKNSNAALTVLRHFDSATVVRGFVGGPPKTAWVMDYPMFERVHYLLVAGFDVFGNVAHQVMSRLYMDFLRMEGEANYLTFVPSARRRALAESWYQGVSGEVRERMLAELTGLHSEPDLRFKTPQPELELDALLQQRLHAVMEHRYTVATEDAVGRELAALDKVRGLAANALPELSFVEVEPGEGKPRYYTIVRDSAHTNVAQLFDEDDRRVKEADELRVVPGFLGSYPNALFHVRAADLPRFVQDVSALKDNDGYRALRVQYGVLRYSTGFWSFSDRMHAASRAATPLEYGAFDFNRLQAP